MTDPNPEPERTPEEESSQTPEPPAPLVPRDPVLETPLDLEDTDAEEETQELKGMPGMTPREEAQEGPADLPPDFEPIESVREDPGEPEAPEPSPYFPEGTYQGAQEAEEYYDYSDTTPLYEPFARTPPENRVLGMTAAQRFLVALMLLLVILVLGTFFLLISGKIALPFL
jgi:hypothetical protein